jgi:hypothetical protein
MGRMQVRKRAPGGGRKQLDDDDRLLVFPFRIQKDLRKKLEVLANTRGTDTSTQVRAALSSWLKRPERSPYTETLTAAIAVFIRRIEEAAGTPWTDDPAIGQLVRAGVERLVAHIFPTPAKLAAVPAEVKEEADLVLTLLTAAVPRPGSPRLPGGVIIDDEDLATAVSDLARHIGGKQFPNVRTLPELVARRNRERMKQNQKRRGKSNARPS